MDLALVGDLGEAQVERLRGICPGLSIRSIADRAAPVDIIFGGEEPELGRRARRWWQTSCTGIEQLVGATGLPPQVTNGSGVEAVPIAEFALAAILDHVQVGVVRRAAEARREWPERWQDYLAVPLRGRTMAVVGYGSIGREVARLGAAFGMRVLACKGDPARRRQADGFREPGTGDPAGEIPERLVSPDRLHEIFAEADHIVVTLPLTESTRGLIDAALLARCKAEAFVVNVGRGAVIEEEALLAALRERRLGGATLDVFTEEPVSSDSELWSTPRLTVTPHIAGGVRGESLFELFAANLERLLRGEPLLNLVDLGRGY